MTDRTATLGALVDDLRAYDCVEDAFLAKSFTDRLVVLDLEPGTELPDAVRSSLRAHGLRGANEVYASDGTDGSFAGVAGDAARHQFVDTETRGDHQSYVLE